jgi:hypothetical protein
VRIDGRPLLLIRWRDAATFHAGWEKLDKIAQQTPPIVFSVGWLLKRTKHHVVIVSSIVGDEASCDVVIPTGMIVSEKELKA